MAEVIFDEKKIRNFLLKTTSDIPFDRISRSTILDIKRTVRKSGLSPVTNNKLARLRRSTIKRRKKLARVNRTHVDFSPAKSNLTFSGQLLNAISFKRSRKAGGILSVQANIFVKRTKRRPYKGIRKKFLKNSITNKELSDIHNKGSKTMPARPFLGVSNKQKKVITNILTRFFRKKIRQNFR